MIQVLRLVRTQSRLALRREVLIFHGLDVSFLNRPASVLNRHLKSWLPEPSGRNLRFLVLVGLAAAVMQLRDELVNASALESIAFWVARLGGLLGSLFFAAWVVDRWFAGHLETPAWLKPAVTVTLVAVVPLTAIEVSLEQWLPLLPTHDDSELREYSQVLAFVGEYATLASVLVPANVLLWFLIDAGLTGGQAPQQDAPIRPDFLEKLPATEASDIIAIAAEEHYIRVMIESGSELVHYRLGDAVEEMPESLGARVHRSWWVADGHVTGARRGQRRWKLLLSNGTWVPVSDSYVQRARDRGFFKQRA